MERKLEQQSENGMSAGPVFVCAFCNAKFQLPPRATLSIRYMGRTPEVECPACREQREATP